MISPTQHGYFHNNLIGWHSYGFMGTLQLSNGVKLAKLRNPWASNEYNGTWGDQDPQWTAELLKEAGHVKGDDGVFFMPFNLYK